MARGVCPVWVGYLLASPVRKLLQNPEKILSPYVKQGMKVLDAGSAMGFFSLPFARMVGPNGKVICVDMQEKMIQSLKRRARKQDCQIELNCAYVIRNLYVLMNSRKKSISHLHLLLCMKLLMLLLFFLRYTKE